MRQSKIMQHEITTLKTITSVKNGYQIKVVIKQSSYRVLDETGLSYRYFLFKAKKIGSPFHNFKEKVKLGFRHDLQDIEAIINSYIAAF